MKVKVVEDVLKLNDEIAVLNRQSLRQAEVFAIDLIGAPGCGKTSLIERTLQSLSKQIRIGVLVGDQTTQRDAERIARYSDQVVQINTGKGCRLDANQVCQGLGQIDLEKLDVLFIENVSNLTGPVGFDLGQDVRVGMFSVSEGDDKAAKHSYLAKEASVLLLNKTDLLGVVPFDKERFVRDVKELNSSVKLIELSALKINNMNSWFEWLLKRMYGRSGVSGDTRDRVLNWCG